MTSLDRVAVELAAHEKVIADGLQIRKTIESLTHEEWSR